MSIKERIGYAAIDSTGFDRNQPSCNYATRIHYRVRELKVMALVDVETRYITDIHSIIKNHDAKIGQQIADVASGDLRSLATNRSYYAKAFRENSAKTISDR